MFSCISRNPRVTTSDFRWHGHPPEFPGPAPASVSPVHPAEKTWPVSGVPAIDPAGPVFPWDADRHQMSATGHLTPRNKESGRARAASAKTGTAAPVSPASRATSTSKSMDLLNQEMNPRWYSNMPVSPCRSGARVKRFPSCVPRLCEPCRGCQHVQTLISPRILCGRNTVAVSKITAGQRLPRLTEPWHA